jgi:hypothetical protein
LKNFPHVNSDGVGPESWDRDDEEHGLRSLPSQIPQASNFAKVQPCETGVISAQLLARFASVSSGNLCLLKLRRGADGLREVIGTHEKQLEKPQGLILH